MRSLVPGDYKLFAWQDAEPFAYNDPDFLRKYEELGLLVKVSESANLNIEAKMIPANQEVDSNGPATLLSVLSLLKFTSP